MAKISGIDEREVGVTHGHERNFVVKCEGDSLV